jgi:uncharacterized protein YfdQ (DUF2303 family)
VLRDEKGNERVEWIEERQDTPDRKTGTVSLNDADSFVRYYNLHASAEKPPIYGQLRPVQFVSVLNDHTAQAPGWADFKAIYAVQHSPEWKTWIGHNGNQKAFGSTEEFAYFIEENSLDIVSPDASDMLTIALNFKLTDSVNFRAAQRLDNGQVDFQYTTMIDASAGSAGGGKLTIPETIGISIPVFDALNPKKYELDARFRYRLSEGRLKLWYELILARKAEEAAFKDLLENIESGTGALLLNGIRP